jgi:hypothetical protein
MDKRLSSVSVPLLFLLLVAAGSSCSWPTKISQLAPAGFPLTGGNSSNGTAAVALGE